MAKVTEAEMLRAMSAATKCGMSLIECIMKPGEVRLVFNKVETDQNLDDDGPKPKEWPRC